jgi:hypothetical protein
MDVDRRNKTLTHNPVKDKFPGLGTPLIGIQISDPIYNI